MVDCHIAYPGYAFEILEVYQNIVFIIGHSLVTQTYFDHLQNDEILGLAKLKAFADNKINKTEILNSVCSQGPKNFRILTRPPAILHLSYS